VKSAAGGGAQRRELTKGGQTCGQKLNPDAIVMRVRFVAWHAERLRPVELAANSAVTPSTPKADGRTKKL